jgi:hypothetical protein
LLYEPAEVTNNMSFWQDASAFGERALATGVEFGAHALEAMPGIGSIPAIISGAGHADAATDARLDAQLHPDDKDRVAKDNLNASYNDGQAKGDFVHAIPLVGAAMDVAEVVSGAASAVTGGSFHEGCEKARDSEIDFMDWATGTNTGFNDRTGERHAYERQQGE